MNAKNPDPNGDGQRMVKASDLLVSALENEGVALIFYVAGEEILDIMEALRTSKIKLMMTHTE